MIESDGWESAVNGVGRFATARIPGLVAAAEKRFP
jgi:hypothetical protein